MSRSHESPTVDFTFEQWISHHWSLLPPGDFQMKGISPMHLLQVDNRALREERDKLKLMIQQIITDANNKLGALAQQIQANNTFFGAAIHSLGGEMHLSHDSIDFVRGTGPYRINERVDEETHVTVFKLAKIEPKVEAPAADAAPTAPESEPAEQSMIKVVSR